MVSVVECVVYQKVRESCILIRLFVFVGNIVTIMHFGTLESLLLDVAF